MKDKITIANLADYYQNEFKVEQKLLSNTITNNIKDVLESIDFYNDDKEIAGTIDEFIARINEERNQFKNSIITTPIPKKESIKVQKKISSPNKKAIKQIDSKKLNLLNKFPNSLMIIKRFASLMKNQKPKEDFLKLLKKIKKDMIDIAIKKADIGTTIILEIQSLLNGWLIDKSKKPDTELKQVYEKAIALIQEYKVNPWATLQKYAITNIDNNTQEFKTKLQNRKNKLQKTMNNDNLKNLNPQEPISPLAGLQGVIIYKPKMPVWVNRLKEFVHKSDKIKSYQKDKKMIVALLRKIQTNIINLAIRKADKGSELINQIQHFLIDTIKAKKWDKDKAKKLAKKAIQLTEKYKINPSSALLRKALKEPNEAVQQAKKLKGEYKYKKLITSTAHGNPVPPLTAKTVKKKS